MTTWSVMVLFVSLIGCGFGCTPATTPSGIALSRLEPSAAPADVSVVTLTVLHLNDVYEITPLAGGRHGGLARVAAVRRELLAQNPHTVTVLAGDLFNPSAMGTAEVDGAPLLGRQMVDVMNAVGLDYATFGNHEFDLPERAFLQRLAESTAT